MYLTAHTSILCDIYKKSQESDIWLALEENTKVAEAEPVVVFL